MRASSVRIANKSAALTMNCASTRTVEVFITFFAGFAVLEDDEAAVVAATAAGVTREVDELLRGVA